MAFTKVIFCLLNCLYIGYVIDSINSVRWSPSGDMLSSASSDHTVALLDFKTGEVLFSGKTSDEGNISLVTQL